MLRLIKYAKPYRISVLLAIVLLFIMGNADLALPDYLSRIVNVGIQSSGVEGAAPRPSGEASWKISSSSSVLRKKRWY